MATAEFTSRQVDILYDFDENPICAGTLITSYLVLTVFNCLAGKNKTKLKVRVSTDKNDLDSDNSQINLINVDEIHSYPARKSDSSENDIALIVLDPDFHFNKSVSPLKIIDHDSKEWNDLIALSSASPSSSCGDFPVEKAKESNCATRDGNLSSSICVKKVRESSCPFPAVGSGLICKVEDAHFLCGALAEKNGNFGAYTNIFKYRHWIRLAFEIGTRDNRNNAENPNDFGLTPVVFAGHQVSSSSPIPYQLSLQIKVKESWQHICGAVIIDRKTALTAAHCFQWNYNANLYRVVAGITQLDSNSISKQTLLAQKIIPHSRYKGVIGGNDIAIIHVHGSFLFNEKVQDIWISPPRENNSSDFLGRVSGWGKVSNNSGVSNSLQEADMKILVDSECRKPWTFLKSSMICSFDNVSNICGGDSGGPLVIQNYQFNQNTTRDLLVGISSFGPIDCEKPEEPNGFTEVSHFLDWIKKNRASKCGATEFQCWNGQCIDECSLCNGADECGDGSTEKRCEEEMDVTQLKHCLRKNQQELKNKMQVEEMLLNFVDLLAPSETESRTREMTSRATRLQVLVGKYGNKTFGGEEFIKRVNSTLKKLERTEEESGNETQKIQELQKKGRNLESKNEQLENRVSSQSRTINGLEEERGRTLITLRMTEEDVQNKAQRIQFLEENEDRLEMSLKEWQNLTISQRESLERCNGEMKNLNETLSQKTANCTPKARPTLTTTRKVNAPEEEQSPSVGASAAVAYVYECGGSSCDYTREHYYDATRDGNCKTYYNIIKSVELTGSCVTLYQWAKCSGKEFQLNTENSEKGLQVLNLFPYQTYGFTVYDRPRSIGPCSQWINE